MPRTCLKCSHVNTASTGARDEACPQCGAIYAKLESAMAISATERQRSAQRSRAAELEVAPAEGITQRQVVGFLGAAVLATGVFMPLISGPFGMTANYFANGKGDGVFILGMAVCSAALVLARNYRLLWLTGGLSLGMLAFTFYRLQSGVGQIKAEMESSLQGNPFRGLADAALQSMQMQWGWAVLVIGAVLILASAAMQRG